jgi:hypothetical protein
VSSFEVPHHFYLFSLRNGRKKLAYGASPEAALEILRLRLTTAELDEIDPSSAIRIRQHELQKYAPLLG